ncbi:MAG: enoyl-CoA hydratase/isomerase family protein [Acidimicrobiia bacterium]|nr:enoyl-CoA hydratase/isomerase family protein [Acidimicrobiia bacterium]
MSELETVLYDVAGRVATVTINRPERHNAMSPQVMAELREAFATAKADPGVGAVVLTGAGDKAFCAGADLGASFVGDELPGPLDLHHARGHLADLFRDMWRLGKPVVARVQGYCLAGGMGLALACDFVMASERATFGVPEIDRGLWPMMISVVLMDAMAPKTALELMMTGRRVSAAEAARIGFVRSVSEPEALDADVAEFVGILASKSPAILRLGRDAYYATRDMPRDAALAYLQAMLSVNTSAEDAAEGIAAFMQKRDPVWKGR